MRRSYPQLDFLLTCLPAALFLLAATAPAGAQEPTPAPSPVPAPAPKPVEVPDPLTDLEKAAQLKDKPEFRPSRIKPVAPLFNPDKEALFTVSSNYRKPGRLKLGAFFPKSGTLKDTTASTFIAVAASVDLPPRGITRPFTPEVYLDSAFHVEENADTASFIGGGIGFRFYPGAKPGDMARRLSNPRLFVGAGVGAYFVNYDSAGVQNDSVKGGGKLALGLDFADDFSLEGNYSFIGKLNGVDFGGVSVLLGYRF